ncbi:MAG: hypothetical protein H5T84_01810, partial [Thermoleophilia bacterium]|nr:hypothetical protein [Thermoleophilia bacterium]
MLCCPLIQIAREVFGEDLNSTWLKAAAATEKWLYPEMIRLAGLEGKVVATADRFACLRKEDHVCRGVYEYAPGTGGTGGATDEVAPKGAKFGDPRDLSLDEILDYCMAVTDLSPEEQCLRATKAQYAGVYLTWKCLYKEFGAEEAEKLYWECWKQLLKMSYDRASKELGLTQPKTARDVGRIHQAFFVDVPSRYRVVKDS